MQLTNAKIDQLKKYFQDKPVVRAFLFGSYARDDADTGSDIDILVELDYTKRIGLEFIKMKYDIEDFLDSSVDLISEKALSSYIKPYVDKEKVLIYERH
jgi:predicted nucleotidyltransferase